MDLHDFYHGKYVAKMCKLIGKDSVCHTCRPVYTGCYLGSKCGVYYHFLTFTPHLAYFCDIFGHEQNCANPFSVHTCTAFKAVERDTGKR